MTNSQGSLFLRSLMMALWLLAGWQSTAAMATGAGPAMKAPSIDAMVEPLRQKLRDNPEDMGNWVLLAQSYNYLGRYEEARDAFAHAKALGYVASEPPPPAPALVYRGPTTDPILMRWMAEKMQQPPPNAGN